MKKIIAFLLASFMLLTLISCAKKTENDKEDAIVNDDTIPKLFKDTNYEGKDFVIACIRKATAGEKISHYSELIADSLTGDPINDAIYERNQKIQSTLNCNIVPYEIDSSGKELKTTLLAGNPDGIDACFINGINFAPVVSEDLAYNLHEFEDLGLENEWWHQSANESMTLNGRLYGAVGDFSSRGLVSMTAVFFNKTMIEKFEDLEDPYTLVREGRWTIDVLTKYAKTMTDLGGNDTLEIDDRVGFVTEWGSGYYYMAAAGVRGFTNDGNQVSFTMNTPEAQSMITKISELLTNKLVTKIVVDSYNDDYTATGTLGYFSDHKIAFFSNYIYAALELRDMEADFGMLPLPKLSETQPEYCSVANRWIASYAIIPLSCDNPEEAAVVLNALAFYGNKLLKEAIYDRSFRSLKLLRDEDSVEMFELILATQRQDLGLLFNTMVYDNAVRIAKTSPNGFASTIQKQESAFMKIIDSLHEIYGVG